MLGSVPMMLEVHDSDNLPEEKIMATVLAHLCTRLLQSSKEIYAGLKIQRLEMQSCKAYSGEKKASRHGY